MNFEALGGQWDSISEGLGSEGVKVYLSHSFRCRIEVHFGDLSVLFFKQASLWCFFRYFWQH